MKQFSTCGTVGTLIWKKPAFVLLRDVGVEFKPSPINLISPATRSQEWRILPLFATWQRAELLKIYCLQERNMTLHEILLLVSCFLGTAWLYIWMLLHFLIKHMSFQMGAAHSHFWYLASENWHVLCQTLIRFSCCKNWLSKLKACPRTCPVVSIICRGRCHGRNASTA